MNYYRIGQQIRKYRKACGLSQEQLAEMINVSVTHMSHIETGNTKLSLSVFVAIANALEISTDDLLRDIPSDRERTLGELASLLDSCSAQQLRVITEVVKSTKVALDKHLGK